ncbi:hypothetical protein [Oscillibacter sp.]|jgi:hypothetical protein|uniref:hypothetical protein n=2 Tax=Oscillibacter TaxID=459786 RepID=UPI00216E1CF9|nr:hypothetical protein [Oscillibacter sp.]MCI9649300.1 hypothetical protein [Oscillibacter sp.]
MRKRKNPWLGMLRGLLLPAAAAVALVMFAAALDGLSAGRDAEDLRQLEEALRRGCAACYAAEGVYPPNLEYLEDHYGIRVDEERYAVFYSAFADNLMPDVTVVVRVP